MKWRNGSLKNRDKLGRIADTLVMARATLAADVPYWVTLTPRESWRCGRWRHDWYRNHTQGRRAFREFVKRLCAKGGA